MWKRKLAHTQIAWPMLLAALCTATAAEATTASVSAYLTCPTSAHTANQFVAQLYLKGNGKSPLGAYSVTLTFDAAQLSVASVSFGSSAYFSSTPTANAVAPGAEVVAGTQTVSLTAPTGNANVANVTFNVLAPVGQSAKVALTLKGIYDVNGILLPLKAPVGCAPKVIASRDTWLHSLFAWLGPREADAAELCGDLNGDGAVNIGDALLAAQVDVGLKGCCQGGFRHPNGCDVNNNGTCDIGDALLIAQCDVGLRPCSFTCSPSTTCVGCCGNGVLDPGEQCDDGNATAWDGCSPTCTIEPQCYDVLNISDADALDATLTQAINSAISHITASGVNFDWTNISHRQMVFDRLPAELQCALNLNGGTGAAAALASAAVSCPAPPEGDCNGTYSSSIEYCGFGCGSNRLLDTSCNGYDCLNCGCFQHDNCTRGLCISPQCQFIGNGDCDSNFFTTARDTCGRQQLINGPSRAKAACSILVYGIAKLFGLFNAHANPLCDPTQPTTCTGCDRCAGCTGSSCDTALRVCQNITGIGSGTPAAVQVSSWEFCINGGSVCPTCIATAEVDLGYRNCAGYPLQACYLRTGTSTCGTVGCGGTGCDPILNLQVSWDKARDPYPTGQCTQDNPSGFHQDYYPGVNGPLPDGTVIQLIPQSQFSTCCKP